MRIRRTPVTAGVLKTLLVAALVLAVGGAGCESATDNGSGAGSPGTETPSTEASPATGGPGSSEPTAVVEPLRLKVYFSYQEKMQPVYREVPPTKAVLAAAMKELLAGPSADERAAGLSTQVPAGTSLRSVSIANGIATVDLTGAYASGGGTLSMSNRLAQVIYTLTQYPNVKGVSFKLDGKPIDVLGGEGIMLEGPQTRTDCGYSTPAILLDEPPWGAASSSPLKLSGTADVFEGVFQLQVLDPAGGVKATQTVHASSGTGTRGTWSATVPFSLGTEGAGKVRVFTLSAKDGTTRENVVEVPVYLTH